MQTEVPIVATEAAKMRTNSPSAAAEDAMMRTKFGLRGARGRKFRNEDNPCDDRGSEFRNDYYLCDEEIGSFASGLRGKGTRMGTPLRAFKALWTSAADSKAALLASPTGVRCDLPTSAQAQGALVRRALPVAQARVCEGLWDPGLPSGLPG